jgi:hypothetical protein
MTKPHESGEYNIIGNVGLIKHTSQNEDRETQLQLNK